MGSTIWLAVRDVGSFRAHQTYTSAQLGVLGRMAVKAGHLIGVPGPSEPVYPQPVEKVRKTRKRKGWADGEVPLQSGGAEEVGHPADSDTGS